MRLSSLAEAAKLPRDSGGGLSMTLRFTLLAATCLFAGASYAQPAPTPPVAPPLPQPGAAEPMMQAKPAGIASAPAGGKKDQAWDVNARHGPGHDVPIDVTEG